jgi:hypothetical protein
MNCLMKSIEQTIKDVDKALRAGILPKVIRWALVGEGWSVKRAALVVRWAEQAIAKESVNVNIY